MSAIEIIESLMRTPEYKIVAYTIDETDIILFVEDMVPAQADMPKFIDGRDVKILKAT
jgi:hypothetical protein